MHVFISMHLGYSLRNPSCLPTENLIQVSEFLLEKRKQCTKYILYFMGLYTFMYYRFSDRSSSNLLFKMVLFTYILLLSLFWIFFICDIAIDLFWSEIIGFISVKQTSGLSEWIIINFFFFFFPFLNFFFKEANQQLLVFPINCTLRSSLHSHSILCHAVNDYIMCKCCL